MMMSKLMMMMMSKLRNPPTATHMADDDAATVQTRAHHADGFRTQRASQLSSLSSFLHKAVWHPDQYKSWTDKTRAARDLVMHRYMTIVALSCCVCLFATFFLQEHSDLERLLWHYDVWLCPTSIKHQALSIEHPPCKSSQCSLLENQSMCQASASAGWWPWLEQKPYFSDLVTHICQDRLSAFLTLWASSIT